MGTVEVRLTPSSISYRWWSDCTANWREKWTKVRIERNKAIEEVRETRREADRLAAERDRVREENEMLRSEVRELRSRGNGEDQSRGNVRTVETSDDKYYQLLITSDLSGRLNSQEFWDNEQFLHVIK